MADETRILNGSFKGVEIAIISSGVDGGRKISLKQFPNRDTQSVEDLGLKPRKYTLEIFISDKANGEIGYFDYRDNLLAVLESKGPGELIHPLYGRITNAVSVGYSLNENFHSFGDTVVTANFEVNNSTGIPESSGSVITQISSANDDVQDSINEDVKNKFNVVAKFTENFQAGVDKVNGIIDKAEEATAFIGEAADTLNTFAAEIGELSAKVNSLVSDPLALADSITSLFGSVNGLYASASATFDTFTGFFDFGSDDEEIKQDTAGRIEKLSNNELLNGSVAAATLSYAYLAVTRIDFETVREIDEITATLDAQYDLVLSGFSSTANTPIHSKSEITVGGISQETKDAVTDMRVKVLAALDEIRVNTSQIVTVHTNPTTARVLGFSYYGDDTQGQALVDLNGFTDVSFIEGNVEILTT